MRFMEVWNPPKIRILFMRLRYHQNLYDFKDMHPMLPLKLFAFPC